MNTFWTLELLILFTERIAQSALYHDVSPKILCFLAFDAWMRFFHPQNPLEIGLLGDHVNLSPELEVLHKQFWKPSDIKTYITLWNCLPARIDPGMFNSEVTLQQHFMLLATFLKCLWQLSKRIDLSNWNNNKKWFSNIWTRLSLSLIQN